MISRAFSRIAAALLFVLAVIGTAQIARAHPHVFVDAKAEIVFDGDGRIESVRNIWRFDEAFSAYATFGLDENEDGELSPDELAPLAKVNVEALAEFDFFTYLEFGETIADFTPPTEYFLTYDGVHLTLYYTLPLAAPLAAVTPAKLDVFDPEYFVAFDFVDDEPARLVDAPDGCTVEYHPPGELDAQTMAILSAIPMDQRNIPDDLVAAASVLANAFLIDCSAAGIAVAAAEAPAPPPAPRQPPPSPFGIGLSDSPSSGWFSGPFGGFFLWVGQRQSEFYRALTSTFAEIKADGTAAFLLLGISFLYGIFHAAGPGHGKAVITSYLFATGERLRRGIAISFASAFVQAVTAIVVVGVAALVFRAAAQTLTVTSQWIEVASYALIVAVGLWLVWAKVFGGGHHHHHHHHDAGGHDHGHSHDHGHDHDHGHSHEHDHAHDSAHTHKTAAARPRSPVAAAIAAVLAVGIRPCTGAIIVLVFALSQGMFAVGVAATLVMALGTGITVAALAALAVGAHGLALRFAGAESGAAYRVVRGLEIAAAFLVLALGLVLLGGALAVGLPG